MKNFYYFSKNKLKFVEIRNFYRKFVFLILFFSFLISFFIFGTYFIIKEFVNPDAEVKSLQTENRELLDKMKEFSVKFKEFNTEMTRLSKFNNELRLAANLDPVDEEDKNFGTGGNVFKDVNISSSEDVNNMISTLNNYVDNIQLSLNYEKNNYKEIKKNLDYNNKLYDALPAIKPSDGRYGDKFGMRYHPILKIRRMHYGVDIISERGTPVYAPGGGKVEFVGIKGGYGNTVIIDHGFGYKTLYSHLSKFKVKKGQTVARGDEIALTGNSGRLSTGPHLHYEITHNGIALDPRNFIFDDVDIFEINQEAEQ
ncbi:MAG: hypothetical protein CVV23_15090 [Ignavibacteriae bacterium HGW-Ignavibacteriae-2]|jgi:murein DD-endopeptidase MepM/ murein hydrolase activator NlpD|nr:M23 family metallopeptidase [Bacteroidota bacterium]PKL87485.1 MAG: hypothetical protein CVV23_15090 [Ignavibacteriae bacterium HGW-Ignavibacteriae-2]PKP12430.1 MAG: hypothetical protein CVU08_10605 [Bacteroidetes bacterium HGW-Bacteroidetes-3]